jgi:hypothetical protein
MVDTAVVLHANLLYAEIPLSDIPRLVEECYLPVLESILNHPEVRVAFNFSGFSLELINGEHPEIYKGKPLVLSFLREGIEKKQVEVTGSSWSHAILPLMPIPLMQEDIRLFASTAQRILDCKPRGFFPPEMGISPLLPRVLLESGYEWSFFDGDFIGMTEKGNLNAYNDFDPIPISFSKLTARVKFRSRLSQYRHLRRMESRIRRSLDFRPIQWFGTEDSSIPGLICDSLWLSYSLICLSHVAFLNERRLLRTIDMVASKPIRGLFIPYCSDVEFFGYGGNTIKEPIPVSRLEIFLRALSENPTLNMTLPSEFLDGQESSGRSYYLKSGSWSTDMNFDMWECEPDNALLNRLSQEAYDLFISGRKKLKSDEELRLLKALLLSYNSDGRGWTPLAEHRLLCFNKALEVRSHFRDDY